MSSLWLNGLNWILTRTIYRVKVVGKENFPSAGGALIVCNHVSYIDACLLLAASKRPVRFLMDRVIHEHKFIHPVTSRMGTIPVATEDGPKAILKSLMVAREAIRNGELVCIFAEGRLTRLGNLLSFHRGLEQIMKGVDAPIIPTHIDRIWGSIFSFRDGKFFWKKPQQIPHHVTISFGKPLPANTSAFNVREVVQELSTEAYSYRDRKDRLLHTAFLTAAKKSLTQRAVTDSTGQTINFAKLLAGVIHFRNRILSKARLDEVVGILLPPSSAGVIANIGLLAAGKVPVNLNYTASKESLDSAIAQCKMSSIITSKLFLTKTEISLPENISPIFVEECFKGSTNKFKLALNYICTFIFPKKLIRLFWFNTKVQENEMATILFSSGSTGDPKGVMLSHMNILANIEGLAELFQIKKSDKILGVLPFFHSFGLAGTLWLPMISKMEAIYHFNPLDAAKVGQLVAEYNATMLFSTPTFLASYMRKCTAEQFKTLRFVGVGAEKLKEHVAQAFHEKFGILLREGYGATELSPLATLNVPDYEVDGMKQIGTKLGTVGHPIPGVSVKVVDPETVDTGAVDTESMQRRGIGEEGLLLVKGPNVMLGYLGQERKTSEVVRDGWYITGDIATIDADGFVTITDRLSRFSKIAGEMVPHIKVEQEIHEVLGETEQVCVITAVADEKKGEKLIALFTKEVNAEVVVKKLSESGIPNLWIPKKENMFVIEKLPLLGSGKLDLRALKQIAEELT